MISGRVASVLFSFIVSRAISARYDVTDAHVTRNINLAGNSATGVDGMVGSSFRSVALIDRHNFIILGIERNVVWRMSKIISDFADFTQCTAQLFINYSHSVANSIFQLKLESGPSFFLSRASVVSSLRCNCKIMFSSRGPLYDYR